MIYFLNSKNKHITNRPQLKFSFPDQNLSKNERHNYFKDFTVKTKGQWFGQLYPYEIYGDVYGQNIIPESLGNPQPYESSHVIYPRSVEEMIKDAKRNRVLRDSWASFFFHPFLLTDPYEGGIGEYPGDTRPLEELIQSIKSLGYKFISLDEFNKTKKMKTKRYYKKTKGWELQ